MAITLTGTGGLFTRLGKLGKIMFKVNGDQSDLATVFGEIAAQYASTLLDVGGRIANSQTGLIRSQSGIVGQVRQEAVNTVIAMVEADAPAAARSLADALNEVRRQMIAGGATVKTSTVSVAFAAVGSPTGSGVRVSSTKRGDGLVQENMFAEVGRLVCTADSYSGGATAGREPFRYVGESNLGASIFDYDWPNGSEAATTLRAVSADEDASQAGNLLTNGDMETWSGGTPTINGNNWVTTGTAGTDFAQNASSPFRGSFDFKFLAGTGANTALAQTFNSAAGTTTQLKPLTSYAFNVWMKRDGVVTAGVITVDLVDGSDTVINDAQGVPNSFTQTCSALTTSYAGVNGVFRLPAVLPSTVKLRIRMSTALTGANVLMDDVCLTPLTAAYVGGPGLAVFSGVTPFVLNDTWTVTGTNNRGGASFLATFQALFDRFFNARQLNFLLPSDAAPTIADSLISA